MAEQVTIYRPGPAVTDEHGNAVPGPLTPIGVLMVQVAPAHPGVAADPSSDAVTSAHTLYYRSSTPSGIRPGDHVEVRGVLHEIDGLVQEWRSAQDGAPKGEQIAVKRRA